MNTLKKISMMAIVAGLSLAATGLFAADGDTEGRRKGRRGGGKRPEFLKDLSKEDGAKLREIHQSMRKEIQTVMKSDSEDKKAKIKEIVENYGPKIKAIVGDEAYGKMQAMRQKRMQNRGGKGGKGGKGGMMQGLSEEQKTQLKALHQEMKKDMEATRAKYEGRIKAIVGEEIFEKMKAMRQKRGGKRGEGGEQRRRRKKDCDKGNDQDD
jgi:hypothetical protein